MAITAGMAMAATTPYLLAAVPQAIAPRSMPTLKATTSGATWVMVKPCSAWSMVG
jgi:hypothetical protein